ncbi:unnamed protein product, partial [Fusarium graminearum]
MRPKDYDDTSYGRVFCLPIPRLHYLAELQPIPVSSTLSRLQLNSAMCYVSCRN